MARWKPSARSRRSALPASACEARRIYLAAYDDNKAHLVPQSHWPSVTDALCYPFGLEP
jgi:hypothetical protein